MSFDGTVVVAGAGAVGCLVGGLLARQGVAVTLLAHGPNAEALADRPLKIESGGKSITVRMMLAETASADVVILASKRFQTSEALERVKGPVRIAISLQNGVEKNLELIERFGRVAVCGATAMTTVELDQPGVVVVRNLGDIYLGSHPEAPALADAMTQAGFGVHIEEEIDSVEWSKLTQVAALMSVQTVSHLPLHELYLRTPSVRLMQSIIAECAELAVRLGTRVGDWPALLPIATLAAVDEAGAGRLLGRLGRDLTLAGATRLRTSMMQSLDAGRPTELESIQGALLRLGRAEGLPMSFLDAAYNFALLAGA